MPTFNARMEGDAEDKVYDTFTYEINDADWVDITASVDEAGKSEEKGTDSVYIYAYKTVLPAGESISTLFDTIVVPDFTKTEAISDAVMVSGAIVQSEGFDSYEAAFAALAGSTFIPGGSGGEEDTPDPEEPVIEETTLKTGQEINVLVGELAGGVIVDKQEEGVIAAFDTPCVVNITAIKKSAVAPQEDTETNNIAMDNEEPVLTWIDEDTLYFYSKAKNIYLISRRRI